MTALFATTLLLILLGATAEEQETVQENPPQGQLCKRSDDLQAKMISSITQNTNAIIGSFNRLTDLIRKNQKEIMESNQKNHKEIMDSLCPYPWFKFQGLCLWFYGELKFWEEARRICQQNGGELAWIENKSEHLKMNAFLQGKGYKTYYYVGLYRKDFANGALTWVRGNSQYRSSHFTNENKPVFLAISRLMIIHGQGRHEKRWPFLCRR